MISDRESHSTLSAGIWLIEYRQSRFWQAISSMSPSRSEITTILNTVALSWPCAISRILDDPDANDCVLQPVRFRQHRRCEFLPAMWRDYPRPVQGCCRPSATRYDAPLRGFLDSSRVVPARYRSSRRGLNPDSNAVWFCCHRNWRECRLSHSQGDGHSARGPHCPRVFPWMDLQGRHGVFDLPGDARQTRNASESDGHAREEIDAWTCVREIFFEIPLNSRPVHGVRDGCVRREKARPSRSHCRHVRRVSAKKA